MDEAKTQTPTYLPPPGRSVASKKWQAEEIEGRAAKEGLAVRRRGRLKPLRLELSKDKGVDGGPAPLLPVDGWNFGWPELFNRPPARPGAGLST